MGSSNPTKPIKKFIDEAIDVVKEDPEKIITAPGTLGIPLAGEALGQIEGEARASAEGKAAAAEGKRAEEQGRRRRAEASVKEQKQKARRRTVFAGRGIRESLFRRSLAAGGPARKKLLGG
jgi:hypothetical protein